MATRSRVLNLVVIVVVLLCNFPTSVNAIQIASTKAYRRAVDIAPLHSREPVKDVLAVLRESSTFVQGKISTLEGQLIKQNLNCTDLKVEIDKINGDFAFLEVQSNPTELREVKAWRSDLLNSIANKLAVEMQIVHNLFPEVKDVIDIECLHLKVIEGEGEET